MIASLGNCGKGHVQLRPTRVVPKTGWAVHAPGVLELHTSHSLNSVSAYLAPHGRGVTSANAADDARAAVSQPGSGVKEILRKTVVAVERLKRVTSQACCRNSVFVSTTSLVRVLSGVYRMTPFGSEESLRSMMEEMRCNSPRLTRMQRLPPEERAMRLWSTVTRPPLRPPMAPDDPTTEDPSVTIVIPPPMNMAPP
eukprot:6213401-Prymnesium_polylepis.1